MADHTHIEWTDATWNPITGCSIVSPGCTNCYAMKLSGTRLKHHPSRKGLTRESKAGPVWTGEVRFNAQWLDQPLRWTKPRMIFVCAHGDLFAEGVPDEWLDQIFAVMALAPQHTFQVLTKRPERMREYVRTLPARSGTVGKWAAWHWGAQDPDLLYDQVAYAVFSSLPNVWLGVSVEDQRRADERIPILLDTPAAIRWISAEPLLGPIMLTNIFDYSNEHSTDALAGRRYFNPRDDEGSPVNRIDWVVAGGESGHDARPMHPDWARSLRDQCAAAGVPFLFKQWGVFLPTSIPPEHFVSHQAMHEGELCANANGRLEGFFQDPDNIVVMRRVGKRIAGRMLDGMEHNGYPEAPRGL